MKTKFVSELFLSPHKTTTTTMSMCRRTHCHLLARRRCFSASRRRNLSVDRLKISPTVLEALKNGEPVVALESTIVAHGMPYPQNLQIAQEVESILHNQGVTPATIAVKNGVCHVGLSSEELLDLAKAGEEGRATKCSTREFPQLMAAAQQANADMGSRIQWGATTVASTMVLAHKAGIATFVTGGIGGVHRNGHVSMDISADLTELSRTPVVVLSAGIKSILDIRRTLEVLETMGVPTVSYGTSEFPAFFSPRSGVRSPARVDSPRHVADTYWAARDLGLPFGMLVAIPNDDPAGASVERAIQKALRDAEEQGVEGQAVTPFVLKQVAHETGGDSLRSNMSLVKNNAKVGAEIAIAVAGRNDSFAAMSRPIEWTVPRPAGSTCSRVVVLGGTVMDIVARPDKGKQLLMGTSNPGQIVETDGGVGRNIAEALGRLGSNPILYSAVGNDSRGSTLVGRLRDECGVSPNIAMVENANTATYLAVLNGWGDMHTSVADMSVCSTVSAPPVESMKQADILVVDANPPLSVLREASNRAIEHGVQVVFDPTSVPKATAVAMDVELLSCFTYVFPNMDELMAMAEVLPDSIDTIDSSTSDLSRHTRTACQKILSIMRPEAHLIVTLGDRGVLLASRHVSGRSEFRQFPPDDNVSMSNATGAGDSLCGAFVHAILEGRSLHDAVSFGMEAALLSLHCSTQAISPELSRLKLPNNE